MASTKTLRAWAIAARRRKEVSGIIVGNMEVPTDNRTQQILTAAYATAKHNPSYVLLDWQQIEDGSYVDLDADTIITIAEAVRDHVQMCYSLNREIDPFIEDGSITTSKQINQFFFPGDTQILSFELFEEEDVFYEAAFDHQILTPELFEDEDIFYEAILDHQTLTPELFEDDDITYEATVEEVV